MASIINASTSSGLIQTADTSGTLELQSGGSTKLTVSSTGAYGQLLRGTAVATVSGSTVDFTSIPTWAKRITVVFNNVSLAASNELWVRLGTAGTGIYTSGYKSGSGSSSGTGFSSDVAVVMTSGFSSTQFISGSLTMYNVSANNWSGVFQITRYSSNGYQGAFGITLDGMITTVRVMDSAGGTFDSGVVNIFYEG
jgi:hypothetical protein